MFCFNRAHGLFPVVCLIHTARKRCIFKGVMGRKPCVPVSFLLAFRAMKIPLREEARGFFLSILISFFFYFSGPINRINRFKKLPAPYKALIISSAVAFLVLFSITVAYCCRRKRATTTGHVKVMPPSYDEATSTKTKVPMQPLVNEI